MGNLLASLVSAASSMRTLERSLAAVQNNVTNASTPGYARQTQLLKAERFNPGAGLPGGVSAGELISARSSYSERAVDSLIDSAPIVGSGRVVGKIGMPVASIVGAKRLRSSRRCRFFVELRT